MLLYWDLTTFVSCFGYSTSHVTFLLRDVGAGVYKKDGRPLALSSCLQCLDNPFLWTKMPRFCVAANCTNTSARDNVSMFGFPVNNPVVLRKWMKLVQSLPQGSHCVHAVTSRFLLHIALAVLSSAAECGDFETNLVFNRLLRSRWQVILVYS